MAICLERGANDLHMVQQMPLPPRHLLLQQNPEWFILLVLAYPGCPGKKAVKRLCVCDDWRKGVILPFYKGKGSRQDCRNYRGITLLSVPGKVFAHVLLSRVRERLRSHRRVQQSGFTPHRSTIDRIITLQLLLQTRREYCRPLWIAYVDLKAAFDSVNLDAL